MLVGKVWSLQFWNHASQHEISAPALNSSSYLFKKTHFCSEFQCISFRPIICSLKEQFRFTVINEILPGPSCRQEKSYVYTRLVIVQHCQQWAPRSPCCLLHTRTDPALATSDQRWRPRMETVVTASHPLTACWACSHTCPCFWRRAGARWRRLDRNSESGTSSLRSAQGKCSFQL